MINGHALSPRLSFVAEIRGAWSRGLDGALAAKRGQVPWTVGGHLMRPPRHGMWLSAELRPRLIRRSGASPCRMSRSAPHSRSSGDRNLLRAVRIADDDLRRVALGEELVGLYWRGVRRLAGERGFEMQCVVAPTAREGVEPKPDRAAIRRGRDRRRPPPPPPGQCPHLVGAVRLDKQQMVSGLGIGA